MNFRKQIVTHLINDINEQHFDSLENYFAEEVSLSVFTVSDGKYIQVQGVDATKQVFRRSFEGGDTIFFIQKLICEGNTVALSGSMQGKHLFTIQLNDEDDDPFNIKFMAFIEFNNDNKIVNFDYSSHTFETMRLSGIATFKQGNREQINKYLSVLKDSGFIPEKLVLHSVN